MQIHRPGNVEQAEAPIGAASFESTVIETPQQPDGVSCGVCVLIEMQRTVDGETYSRRDSEFTEIELLRCRAKWACELLLNPMPTRARGSTEQTRDPAREDRDPAGAERAQRSQDAPGKTAPK